MAARPPAANGSIDLFGVNLAGAEFGAVAPGNRVGTSHFYPTTAEIDYYAVKGFDVIRLPFKWERVQPTIGGPLDAIEMSYIEAVVAYAERQGIAVILDPHDFGFGYGNPIGSEATPVAAFSDLWSRLAERFADSPNVLFGLMNEPHLQSATEWLWAANAAVAAIRAAGATQEILVPGSYYDGAWSWTTTDNSRVVGNGVRDPLDNFAFDLHQYLDADGSGVQFSVVSETVGVERLVAATAWAERTGSRLFLSEFGVATDQTSLAALENMLRYMEQHADVWQGATYWAAGAWWGDYPFAVEPIAGVDRPQMGVLERHVSPDARPYWDLAGSAQALSSAEAVRLGDAVARREVDFLLQPDGSAVLAGADGLFRSLRGAGTLAFVDGRQVLDAADPAAQVFRLYRAALDREPDQAGLNYGIDLLQGGVPLAQLSGGFLDSPEFALRYGSNLTGEQFVARLYGNVLDRAPSPDEVGFYLNQLGSGVTRSQVLAAFSESPEHVAATAPLLVRGLWDLSEDAALVARLYDTMLGRLPDIAGLGFYREQLERGTATPETVVRNFENSPEFTFLYGREPSGAAFVQLLYRNTLDRGGSAEEQAYYLAQIESGWTREQLVLAFSESPEHVGLTQDTVMSDNSGRYGIAFA